MPVDHDSVAKMYGIESLWLHAMKQIERIFFTYKNQLSNSASFSDITYMSRKNDVHILNRYKKGPLMGPFLSSCTAYASGNAG
jgi:hypothetical protein